MSTLDLRYAEAREKKRPHRYRLWRRTREVLSAIEQFAEGPIAHIVDIGTADGKMLDAIYQRYPHAKCVGVELNGQLADLAKATYPHLEILKQDAQALDLPQDTFDVCVSAAVIEHVPDPLRMMQGIKKILRPSGIVVLTSPDPFWERVAVSVGHLDGQGHDKVLSLKELSALSKECGFTVLKAGKFMLSPIGMPMEIFFERILCGLRLGLLMANQILVARA